MASRPCLSLVLVGKRTLMNKNVGTFPNRYHGRRIASVAQHNCSVSVRAELTSWCASYQSSGWACWGHTLANE